jgi:hypothetical protein
MGMGPHAKPIPTTHPQTHLGSTTQEPRLGTAIFELHSLTQLICIPQAWPRVGLQAGQSGCQSHQYPGDRDGVSLWSIGVLGPPDIIAAWEDYTEFWDCESLKT